MAEIRWQWISAGRKLTGDDDRYVTRPLGGGDRLASMVQRDLAPVAVTGPPGSGRTTELTRAAWLLRERSQGLVVHVNWFDDPAEVEPGPFLYKLARHFFEEWAADPERAHPTVSLVQDIRASDPYLPQGQGRTYPPRIIARQVFGAYAEAYDIPRFVLLLDGLDEVPPERARMVLHKLLEVSDVVDLVVVVGPGLTNGPDSFEVLQGYRIFHVGALPCTSRSAGRRFLRTLALRRLDEQSAPSRRVSRALSKAAELSGGMPKRYLSLLADAARYCDRPAPGVRELEQAATDQAQAMRRLLVAGDLDALRAADGTSGLEVPADKRIRLLAQGLLIEHTDNDVVVVRPHPLLARYLE